MEKKTMGSFIAILRKAKGMTQKELAELLNVSDKAVSRWEREESMPDIVLLPILADIFGVTCDDLLRGEKCSEGNFTETEEKRSLRIKILLKKSLSRFRAFSMIASAIGTVGFMAAVICNFIYKKAMLGFFVVFGSLICALIAQAMVYQLFKGEADTDEVGGEVMAGYRKSLRDGSLKVLYMMIILCAVCLPLFFCGEVSYSDYIQGLSDQVNPGVASEEVKVTFEVLESVQMEDAGKLQVGLQAKTWTLLGGVFMAAGILVCCIFDSLVKGYDKKHDPDGAAKQAKPVKVKYIFGLLSTVVLTMSAAILFQEYMPGLIMKSRTFETFEEFVDYIEGPAEGMTQQEAAIRMMADPVEVYSEEGEFLFKYTKINTDVDRIVYGPHDCLPIKTYTLSDQENAERIIAGLMWLWPAVGLLECAAAAVLYKRKKSE